MGALNSRAWLVRNDGREAKVLEYPQGVRDELLPNVGVAAFLCKYSPKATVNYFVNWYMADLLVNSSSNLLTLSDELLELEIKNQLSSLPSSLGAFQDLDSDDLAALLYRARQPSLYRTGSQAFDFSADFSDPFGNDMWREFNQTFIAARLGGRYVSLPSDRMLHILISSRFFDWTPVIKRFLQKLITQVDVSSVTIERNVESDRREGSKVPSDIQRAVYLDTNDVPILARPVEEVLKDDFQIKTPRKPQAFWQVLLTSGSSFTMFLKRQIESRKDEFREAFTACLPEEYELVDIY